MRKRAALGIAAVAVCLFSNDAHAVTPPSHLLGRPAFQVADGSSVRPARMLRWYRTPKHARDSWRALRLELGEATWAVWDSATGAPFRIWGEGVSVAGSIKSSAVAAKHAHGFLERHLQLLAPGAAPKDFVMVSNHSSAGIRTVGFHQHAQGVRVLGGQVSFRYKNDRLLMIASEALPYAEATVPTTLTADPEAAAVDWVLSDMASSAVVDDVAGPFVLPLVDGSTRFVTVMRVRIDAYVPRGSWDVYVDASTGDVVAREQTLQFATGTLQFNTPERWPGGARIDYPAPFADLTVDNANATTDSIGAVTWPTSQGASLLVGVKGTYANVTNTAGANASTTLQLSPGGAVVWNESTSEHKDAQLNAFIHTNRVIDYVRKIDPSLPYLGSKIPVNVNINNECNAFFNANNGSINFYRSSSKCGNIARLADVVYHEYGHAIHRNSLIPGVGRHEGGLSEGLADFLAATVTGDPAMGIGFHKTSAPLRHIDPPNQEYVWPDDIWEVHHFGLIISGALWDLRKLLIIKHGGQQGVATTDQLFYQAMRRSVDIPSMYFEVLVADDNDGNLDNGTPNICEINEAFGLHGLRRIEGQTNDLGAVIPNIDGFEVTLEVLGGLWPQCANDATPEVSLKWRLREQPQTGGSIAMVKGATQYAATIPTQPAGTVIQYRVELYAGGGLPIQLPDNPADRFYEFFVGEAEPIYCTNFDTDPALDGWTHGITKGQGMGADDWQWGGINSKVGTGDPTSAYSGTNVFGNDLGGSGWNGTYKGNTTNFAKSPVIDTSAYENVRLQYRRWLNVEDGFFDQATIYGNDQPLWTNFDSEADEASRVHHQDKEWRFHDVDLTAIVQNGQVQVKYEIASDQGLHLGGWNLDEWCVIGWFVPVCGDGKVSSDEQCDDGAANSDTDPDACRTDCRAASCGDGVVDSDEHCDDGNDVETDDCDNDCQIVTEPPPTEDPPKEEPEPEPEADQPVFIVDQSFCGCRTVGAPGRNQAWLWLLAALALRRRRES